MSEFFDKLNEYHASNSPHDIKIAVRRCWHFDLKDYDIRTWQGKGKLFAGGQEWLGFIAADGSKMINTPRIADGRDGTAPTYEFTINLVDFPNMPAFEVYQKVKEEQDQVFNRPLICWHALFEVGEGLRPQTPLRFARELTMQSARFNENLVIEGNSLIKKYTTTILAKDGNAGRSNVPGGTYSSTVQRSRANQLGVAIDKGCDFVLALADRTYQHP